MKKYFNVFCLSLIASTSAFATNTFPTTPVITSPVNDERDVPVAAEFSTEVFTPVDINGDVISDPTLQLLRTEWIPIVDPDANTIYFGGQQTTPVSNFNQLPESSFQYDIPASQEMIFNETRVRRLKIKAFGVVELLSESDEIIATIFAQPDSLEKLEPSALHPFIALNSKADSVVIRWDFSSGHFVDDSTFAIEANILNSGIVELRLKLESTLSYSYRFTGGRFGVEIGSVGRYQSLSVWGSDTMDPLSYYGDFGFSFQKVDNNSIYHSELADKNLISEPANLSNKVASETITTIEMLEPFSTYQLYARHVTQHSEESGDGINKVFYSDLSAPVTFETARSKYRIAMTSDSTVISGSKATVSFVLTNEGTYPGEPRVKLTLPVKVIGIEEGNSVNQELEGNIESGECASVLENRESISLSCSGVVLAPGESTNLRMSLTFNQAGEIPVVTSICETLIDNCDMPELQQSLLTVSEQSSPQGSDSSGGTVFWLTFLALPLMRLRRTA